MKSRKNTNKSRGLKTPSYLLSYKHGSFFVLEISQHPSTFLLHPLILSGEAQLASSGACASLPISRNPSQFKSFRHTRNPGSYCPCLEPPNTSNRLIALNKSIFPWRGVCKQHSPCLFYSPRKEDRRLLSCQTVGSRKKEGWRALPRNIRGISDEQTMVRFLSLHQALLSLCKKVVLPVKCRHAPYVTA